MTQEEWYKLVYTLLRPAGALAFPMKIIGRENVPEGAAIICADHSNAVDPVLLSFALGRDCYVRHFAKAESRSIPVMGWLMSNMGSIFVRRGEQDIDAFKSCLRALKAGEKIILFPEGTRVHGGETVEAKTGAVRMAARLGVPIIPAYLPRDKKPFHRVRIVFGEPYHVSPGRHEDYAAHSQELLSKIMALGEKNG